MNTYNRINISSLPTAITYQPSCIRSIPMSVECNDVWGNGGSGIGAGSEAIRSALGEYFERRHFYMEIIPDLTGTLDTSLTAAERTSFVTAFHQTCEKKASTQAISEHRYNLSEVYRASDFSSCHVPTACISLSAHNIANDSAIYPLRDTCGCSFHWDPMAAIFGSLKEQLERQFLARFWLTKKCHEIMTPNMALDKLKNTNSLSLYKHLILAGDVAVIDISDSSFPGVCILTVYGNRNNIRHVKYCAGMAYAANAEEALDKSIRELWQTYRFIDLFCATKSELNEIDDPYLRHFLNCNDYKTYQEITAIQHPYTPTPNHKEKFNVPGLLKALDRQNVTGFIYIKPIAIENSNYFASKYLSPDLFLHMNNSKNINTRNNYSKKFFHEIHENRKNIMTPFP